MKQDFVKYLPPEIITNIFLRLPDRTIAISKCVSKPWRDLLKTDFFVDSHLAKSVPYLAMMIPSTDSLLSSCQVLEFDDQLDDIEVDEYRCKQTTEFNFPNRTTVLASVNGLLLLHIVPDVVIICNPITRHSLEIGSPVGAIFCRRHPHIRGGAFGFGVSRVTRQYKVVWINPKFTCEFACHVYTVGTGSWRRVDFKRAQGLLFLKLNVCVYSAFLDGNLHWTMSELYPVDNLLITCFDLETECFSSFRAPASHGGLSVLRGCLCLCDWRDGNVVVWLMKEYGVEKSWSKEYVIAQGPRNVPLFIKLVCPIKIFENGNMLMLWDEHFLIYYSIKTKTFMDCGIFNTKISFVRSVVFTPSFLSPEGLGMARMEI